MTGRVRLVLVLQAAAIAAAATAILLGAGLPLAAARALDPRTFSALTVAAGILVLLVGAAILSRWVGRPLAKILAAVRALGEASPELPPLGFPGEEELSLSRAAVAFERLAAALSSEKRALAAKVRELEAAKAQLEHTRAELDRAERLATLGRLAAGIAHEVGNPLGAIAGYAALARERARHGGPEAEIVDFLDRMLAATGRIDGIVRGLLDFARPAPEALAPVRVEAAVEAALRLARVQPRFRGVEVATDLPGDLPAVLADESRLAQVFLNLFLNAGDAMRGSGEVRVHGRAIEGEVEVSVTDSGPGIAPEDLPRIFDPFFTTKEPGEGTGLGLSVCHGIVGAFGGAISAASTGAGARFVLRLRAT